MYKVFFNDRIVFMNTRFNKSLSKKGVHIEYKIGDDIGEICFSFLSDSLQQDWFITCETLDVLWSDFQAFFKIVAAAGGVVYNSRGELLCIHRLGKWDLPKGKIEKGESNAAAAVREVEEETGISNLEIKDQLETTYHIYLSPYNGKWILKPTYWYRMHYDGNGTLIPQEAEDITKAEWVDETRLKDVVNETYASLVDLFTMD